MTSRERMLAAQRGERPDRVPVSPFGLGHLDPQSTIAAELKGCPVGQGTLLTLKSVTASEAKDRSRVRGQIVTGAKMVGWVRVSVRWTDKNQPFVVRAA